MTEQIRRALQNAINTEAVHSEEEDLRAKYGQLWNTNQMQEDYTVHSFAAPFIEVTRKSDGVNGLLMFSHRPRWYHSFRAAV